MSREPLREPVPALYIATLAIQGRSTMDRSSPRRSGTVLVEYQVAKAAASAEEFNRARRNPVACPPRGLRPPARRPAWLTRAALATHIG
jgi:hypothetical protein